MATIEETQERRGLVEIYNDELDRDMWRRIEREAAKTLLGLTEEELTAIEANHGKQNDGSYSSNP